jgi:crotonobetainyl-CoA:carnitine CoA-transferase CaiB-like acyl-CoA transferase
MASPLSGVTIVDLTRVLSGPYCTMLLADMGARVIKVEHPERGDDTRAWGPPFQERESSYFLSINRNKESITLDFKHEAGRRALGALIARADVLVENFRPGTLERLGLGYEQLRKTHPRLIYAAISGFGQTGSKRLRPGYDAVVQAEGGLMSITGDADGPPYRLGVAIADIVSGMFAAHGITLALWARERTGVGQLVDVSMLDSVAALLTYQGAAYFATGTSPMRMGNRHPTIVPYETYAASDGSFVLAVGNDSLWKTLCTAIGLPELIQDPRFTNNVGRVGHREELNQILASRFATAPRAHWLEVLNNAGIPCGSVRSVGETLEDSQLIERDMIVELQHRIAGAIRVVGTPIKLSETPGAIKTPPPVLGEHTELILKELGYDAAGIQELKSVGAI